MIRTLLVDDDEAILQLFRTVLELSDFTVDTAKSAAEALVELSAKSYEIVISDLRMETSTAGFDVVRAAVQHSPRPLVVLVTAYPVPASEWRKSGADALYVKGANTLALPEQLKSLLHQTQRVQPAAQASLRRNR